jgi:hypothetical protein
MAGLSMGLRETLAKQSKEAEQSIEAPASVSGSDAL